MATVRKHRGKWVAAYTDQRGRRCLERPKGYLPTASEQKRAAQKLLERRMTEIEAGTFAPVRDRLTFAALADLFLESKVKVRGPTLAGYRELIRCYLTPYFGERRVEAITRFEVEAFRNEMAVGEPECVRRARELRQAESKLVKARKPGVRTINKALTLLVGIFGYAVNHGFAARNPAEKMDKLPMPDGEGCAGELNVLTPAEVSRVIEATVSPFRVPILLAAYTGARQAEVLGLRWEDIDWNRGTTEIRRQYRRDAFFAPKTKASRRTVELPEEVIAELKRWRLACPKGEHDLVCPTVQGRPMRGSDLLRVGFLPALRRAGIRRVRFHDLRHSFASNLLAAGIDVVTVSKALGHANVHITLTTYAHAVPGTRSGAFEAMARLLRRDGYNSITQPATAVDFGA